jgi:hypothetical protein
MFRTISNCCLRIYKSTTMPLYNYTIPYPNHNNVKTIIPSKTDTSTSSIMFDYLNNYNKNFLERMTKVSDFKKFRDIVEKIKQDNKNKSTILLFKQDSIPPPNNKLIYIFGLIGMVLSFKSVYSTLKNE